MNILTLNNIMKKQFINFKEWILLIESQTIADYLKSQNPQLIQKIKNQVKTNFNASPLAQIKQPKIVDRFINYFSRLTMDFLHNYYSNINPEMITDSDIKPIARRLFDNLRNQGWAEYFLANFNQLANKLNSMDYTPEVISQETGEWHDKISREERGFPSQEYVDLLKLDNIGWKGWKWVDLEQDYCPEEAEAMGHCGNQGASDGDTIYSLRDAEGYAHLTFIVNEGILGESKGANNQKPSQKYHPAIIALLKSPYIQTIKGGGYKPENNFYLADLTKSQQEEIKKQKPYIGDFFEYAIANDMSSITDMIGLVNLNYDPKSQEFIIETYQDLESLIEDFPNRKGNRTRNAFSHYLNYENFMDNYYGTPDLHDIISDISQDNLNLLKQYFGDDLDERELKELIPEDSDIEGAIERAYHDGMTIGAETEAYKSVAKTLKEGNRHGFYIDITKHPFELKISKNNLKDLTMKEHDGQHFDVWDDIYFYYDPPYYGFTDFDREAFNERLRNELEEIMPPSEQAA